MAETHETIADITAEMRDEAARADMEQGYSLDDAAEMMREFASRFEAAHKRETDGIHRAMVILAGIKMHSPDEPPRLWTALDDAYNALSDALGTDGDITADEEAAKASGRHFVIQPRGDCAKLREVVRKLLDVLYDMGVDENTLAIAVESPNCHMKSEHALSVFKEARAALAAPPRNCDKVKTSWDVLKKWHEGLDTANDIVRMLDWLLAPATEQEGGNDADK